MIPQEARNYEQEKKNVLDILKTAVVAIKRKDALVLRDLSNRTIHSASIYQDTDSVSIAVIIYALSKAFERRDYYEYKDWPFFEKACIKSLENARYSFKSDKMEEFRKNLGEIRESIKQLSGNLKKFIEEVFRRAMISKASRIYEHGISMNKTAEILGISVWELAQYAGSSTGISDVNLGITQDINVRINRAMNLFRER